MGREATLLPTLVSTRSWGPIKTLITQVVGKLCFLLYEGVSSLSKCGISSVFGMAPLGTPVPLRPSPSSLPSPGTVRSVQLQWGLSCVSLHPDPSSPLALVWVRLGWHWLWVSMAPLWLLSSKPRHAEPRPLFVLAFLLPDGLCGCPQVCAPEDAPQPLLTHSSERLYTEKWDRSLLSSDSTLPLELSPIPGSSPGWHSTGALPGDQVAPTCWSIAPPVSVSSPCLVVGSLPTSYLASSLFCDYWVSCHLSSTHQTCPLGQSWHLPNKSLAFQTIVKLGTEF